MALVRAALANPRIALVEGLWAATSLGTWAFTILLALYAYDQSGAGAIGVAVAVRMLPSALAAPYAALLVDRRSRRSVMLASVAARAIAMVAIALAVAGDAPFGVVLVLAALFTVAGTAQKPAQAALLTRYARTPAELAAGNVCWSAIDNAAFLMGSVVAGALTALGGFDVAFAVCAVPFVVGLVILFGLPGDEPPELLPGEADGALDGLLHGARTVAGDPPMRLLLGLYAANQLVQGLVDVLLVVAAIELLNMGQSGAGWLNAAWGVGGIVGGILAVSLVGRGHLAAGITAGCVLAGVPLVIAGALPFAVVAVAVLVVLGVGYALIEVGHLTLMQRLAADDVLGRVFGVQETLYVVFTAISGLLAAAMIALLGITGALVATGVILPLIGLAVRRRLGELEAAGDVPGQRFALLRGITVFAPLPVATIETLAVRAHDERFEAGTVVLREGELGHAFYVVQDGFVEVTVGGGHVRDQEPGTFFGEIALVRDCARTATVTTTTAVTLVVLSREDFLWGIGAHIRSARHTDHVVETRLERAATRA